MATSSTSARYTRNTLNVTLVLLQCVYSFVVVLHMLQVALYMCD